MPTKASSARKGNKRKKGKATSSRRKKPAVKKRKATGSAKGDVLPNAAAEKLPPLCAQVLSIVKGLQIEGRPMPKITSTEFEEYLCRCDDEHLKAWRAAIGKAAHERTIDERTAESVIMRDELSLWRDYRAARRDAFDSASQDVNERIDLGQRRRRPDAIHLAVVPTMLIHAEFAVVPRFTSKSRKRKPVQQNENTIALFHQRASEGTVLGFHPPPGGRVVGGMLDSYKIDAALVELAARGLIQRTNIETIRSLEYLRPDGQTVRLVLDPVRPWVRIYVGRVRESFWTPVASMELAEWIEQPAFSLTPAGFAAAGSSDAPAALEDIILAKFKTNDALRYLSPDVLQPMFKMNRQSFRAALRILEKRKEFHGHKRSRTSR